MKIKFVKIMMVGITHQLQRLKKFVLMLTLSWNLLLRPKFLLRNRPTCLLKKTLL